MQSSISSPLVSSSSSSSFLSSYSSSSSSSGLCTGCAVKQLLPAGDSPAIIGQKVSFKIECLAGTLSEFNWTLPGEYLKNYTASLNSATITEMTNADLTQQTVTFYWMKPGFYEVSVTFTITKDGIQYGCRRKATIEVVEPTFNSVWPTGIGYADADPNSNLVILHDSPDYPDVGIAFKASVTDPAGFTGGTWEYVQTVWSGLTLKTTATGACVKGTNPDPAIAALDTDYPYNNEGPWSADGALHFVKDSPSVRVSIANASQQFREMAFLMYVLYLPPGADSIWVGIKMVAWLFSYCAIPVAGGADKWDVKQKSSSQSGWGTCPNNPTWTSVMLRDEIANLCDCPPACQ